MVKSFLLVLTTVHVIQAGWVLTVTQNALTMVRLLMESVTVMLTGGVPSVMCQDVQE